MTTIYPPAPGCVEGIISRRPIRIQCQSCGRIDDWQTLGLTEKLADRPAVILLSDILFCPGSRRRCGDCRRAENCDCYNCRRR